MKSISKKVLVLLCVHNNVPIISILTNFLATCTISKCVTSCQTQLLANLLMDLLGLNPSMIPLRNTINKNIHSA